VQQQKRHDLLSSPSHSGGSPDGEVEGDFHWNWHWNIFKSH